MNYLQHNLIMHSFTLLDDSDASPAQPTSRLYTDLQQIISCKEATQFPRMIEQLQSALQQGFYAVAVFSYELGAGLQNELHDLHLSANLPPSHILLYKHCQRFSQVQLTQWLQQQTSSHEPAGIAGLQASINDAEFTYAIDQIQRYIARGDTYQVNYTFRFHFHTYGTLFTLYQRLRERQAVPFGALILMPDGSAILSLSPELFIRHTNGNLLTRPMKGTSAALTTDDHLHNHQINAKRSEQLAQDEKNRAENVMIVDLLRNDLGRIAQLGSVQVPQLFEVQQFNSVLQMTSSVTARCRDDIHLIDLLHTIYPCGSITGAPKIRTMQIIHELETQPRGVYTGAIGWFDPTHITSYGTNKIPEFCLSVPIRTIQLDAPEANGCRTGVMGVGAGITYDSNAPDEYQECLLKARFLTALPPSFSLFETMYATRENGCRHWHRHLKRLNDSAHYFGFPFNIADIENHIAIASKTLTAHTPYRLKLSLFGSGEIHTQTTVLSPLTTPVKVMLASQIQYAQDIWLQHKTSHRADYDHAWTTAESLGAFDMLFCNERGELTEGGRSNLLVKLNGHWYTPPLNAGVLPGVMRTVILDNPTLNVTERTLFPDQLKHAEEIAVCNALRGMLSAQLYETKN